MYHTRKSLYGRALEMVRITGLGRSTIIQYRAESDQDLSFVFIGKINVDYVDVSMLERFKNIHFLGKKRTMICLRLQKRLMSV